jgi:hypothetical protein
MLLLPPRPDVCQQCASEKHKDPSLPHNQESLYWKYWFYGQHGRWPTWSDAMAHCTDEVKQKWTEALKQHGIDIETESVKT